MVYLQREGKMIRGNNMAKTNLIPRSLKLKKGRGKGKDQQNMAKLVVYDYTQHFFVETG